MKLISSLLLCFLLFSCGGSAIPEVKKSIDSPFYGNLDAKVQIKIYTDLQCPACIFFEDTIGKTLMSDYALKNKIGITYKMFPLPQHKNAKDDAIAALCAAKQSKYKEFSTKMYEFEKQKGGADVLAQERLKIATEIKLNEAEYTTCVNEKHYLNKIESDMAEGDADKLEGTPSIFINGKNVDMAGMKKEALFKYIDNLIKQGEKN